VSKLEQMRNGMEKLIDIDSDIGTVSGNALIDNGRGQLIPSSEVSEHRIICRVSYQSGKVWAGKLWEGGLTIDNTSFVLARFDADINQGDVLMWRGRKYNVGVLTRPEIDGGYTCAQAPLTEVN